MLDLRCDPNSACRQALRPLRIRIRARSERSVSRQSRAVIPLSALRMVTPLGRGAWAHVQLAEHEASGEVTSVPHKDGCAIHMPSPMNQEYFHCVPKRKRVKDCRISLTYREIVS